MKKLIYLALVLFCLVGLTQCAANNSDADIISDNTQFPVTANNETPNIPVTIEPIVSEQYLTSDEIKAAIVGIWHNGETLWAYNYHTIFYDDGTIRHVGHRNVDIGTYNISEDGTIHASFDKCEYDFPGEGYLKTFGLKCNFRLANGGTELVREPEPREEYVTDNDDYELPLVKVDEIVEIEIFDED
ncbi:MAG: hypothetical protein LBN00_04060 [Oscillospiraceae bacterium]|nr:hypothetical protein [Oscillospiraceae bacterium]